MRVAMEEIKNAPVNGGLGLVCVESMCNSLRLTQFLRLLKSSDSKSIAHIDYWIGDSVSDLLSILDASDHPSDIHDYFCDVESLVMAARFDGYLSANSWRGLTNKIVYTEHTKGFPEVKVQLDAGTALNYGTTWARINSSVLRFPVRDVCFMLVHNKLTTNERLFRIGMRNDPYCVYCPAASICDIQHFFCTCVRVNRLWLKVKTILNSLLKADVDNWLLINFFMPKSEYESEAVWLVANYVALVWRELFTCNSEEVKEEEFFGFLTFKYREDRRGSRITLRDIPNLN